MSLENFLSPHGIAIVGVSSDPSKLGYAVARNLIQGGYQGAVHLINPKGGELFGHKIFISIATVPDPVDLALVIVPALAAPQALREVGRRGIKAAILTSGGFKETGEEGARLEAEVIAVCKEFNIRLIGPNCIGLLDTHLPLDTTFLPPPLPLRGSVSFLSHSGAFCAAVIDWSRAQGFGFARLVSLGNQADLTEADLLEPVADDPNTKAIALYLESIRDGRRFIEVAQKVSRHKPLIALKVGRSEAGQRAAASHTGALAGAESAYEAAFEKAGVLRATTAEELFDWAQALASTPLPRGKRMAILTNAGGPGVMAADALCVHGMELASPSAFTEAALRRLLPPAASAHNPIDMLASATPAHYAQCLQLLLDDGNVDGVLVIIPPSPVGPTAEIAEALIPIMRSSSKPVVINLMGSMLVAKAFEVFTRSQIPTFPFPERAASALGALVARAHKSTMEHAESTEKFSKNSMDSARAVVNSPEELIAASGIKTAPILRAHTAAEAALISSALGFPLVLKIASPDIPHKSDVGGVTLNINSAEAAAEGFDELIRRIRNAKPEARIDGVNIQPQIGAGQEVIVGVVRDPTFGPLVMFGSGGVEVEGLKDIAFALAPLSEAEAEALIQRTWAGRKLRGFRSIAPADVEAVKDVIIRLGQLALDRKDLQEIEINPLRVLDRGAVAIDVRLKTIPGL